MIQELFTIHQLQNYKGNLKQCVDIDNLLLSNYHRPCMTLPVYLKTTSKIGDVKILTIELCQPVNQVSQLRIEQGIINQDASKCRNVKPLPKHTLHPAIYPLVI